MEQRRSNFYKRVRQFCDLRVRHVSRATGITESAIAQIEKGRRQPNPVERKLIEGFLRDRLRMVFELDGPMPTWANGQTEHPAARKMLRVGE
jgi:transcriptional regulator with XRE-family HTH domain